MSVSLARRSTARLLLAGLLATSAVPLTAAVTAAPAAAQTAAPAPSASGRVVLLSSSSYASGSTGLVIVGEVRNDWNKVASPVLTIDLLDAAGTVLDTETSRPYRSDMGPGDIGGFSTSMVRPEGYSSYRVRNITTPQAFDVPNHNFDVVVTGVSATQVMGTVRNTNTAVADRPRVEVLFRDAAGAVYDVDFTFASGTLENGAFMPGEQATWSIPRFSSSPALKSDGTVTALGDTFTAPSPFPTELGIAVPKKVVAGQAGDVTVTVLGRGTRGSAPKGIKVQLFGREAGQSAFRLLRTATTDGGRSLTFALKPQRDIRWQARVPAATNAVASASGFTLSQVAFGVSTTGSTTGTGGTLRGGVRPASAGAVVHLQQQIGGVFRNVASTRLSSTSTYSFTVVKPRGRYVYRVYKPAVTGNQAGYGPVLVYSVF